MLGLSVWNCGSSALGSVLMPILSSWATAGVAAGMAENANATATAAAFVPNLIMNPPNTGYAGVLWQGMARGASLWPSHEEVP